jgi:sulfopyruvate decarboxylase TPP-binding subunit
MKTEYASVVMESLKESGITFVAYLPDDQVHDVQKMIKEDPSFRHPISVPRARHLAKADQFQTAVCG